MTSNSTRPGRRTRTATAAATITALVVPMAGCAVPASPSPDRTQAPAARPTAPASPTTPWEPRSTAFPTPGPAARAVARQFTFAVLEYDARRESSHDFLTRVRPLATAPLQRKLRHSARARLPWPVMRVRGERVTLAVTGTSVIGPSPQPATRRLTVGVNGITTTRTDVAVLRNPVALQLQLARTRNGWRVTGFDGGAA